MTPKTLQNGKYRIVRVLGQGGFGITYEGVQTGLNRRVAIKEFFMSDYCEREGGSSRVTIMGTKGNRVLVERFKEKFLKEAQMIAGLDDVPHIIRIYDVFQENGTAYYVMEYIAGGSLRSLVKQRGRLDEAMAKRYIAQVGEALAELHKRHIMHLDVKPDNIMLKDGEAILIDFGVSKHYDQGGDATTTTPVGRSKGYAPLEQYKQGGVQSFSPETDIYSLGATLYFLLTGQNPPEATELVTSPIICPNYVSENMRMVITKTMQANKERRPNHMGIFCYNEKTYIDDDSMRTKTKVKYLDNSLESDYHQHTSQYCYVCKKTMHPSHFKTASSVVCKVCEMRRCKFCGKIIGSSTTNKYFCSRCQKLLPFSLVVIFVIVFLILILPTFK